MSHFWNHKILNLALILFFVSLSSWAQKVEPVNDARTYLSQISSPADVQTYENYLKQVLPQAYTKGRFTIGVEQNISQEQIFLKRMSDPKLKAMYNSELPQRNPFQELELTTYEKVMEVSQNLKPAVQKDLAEKFSGLSQDYATSESLVLKMSELVFSLNGQSSNGLLTGLVQSLPSELKGEAFKLDFVNKMEYIKINLTQENFIANFKSTYYNVENITPEQMLNEIQRLVAVESQIAEFSLFTYWKIKNFGTSDMYKIKDIDLFKDLDYLSQFKLPATELAKVKEAIKSTTLYFIKNNSRATVPTPVLKANDRITIKEASPFLGLYRGEINNNCSTAMAFGYVYSPAERTYIVEKNGKVIFSLSATEVRMNGKKTLYIHDMGQLSLGSDIAGYIMRGFYNARKELGFEQIAGGFKSMHYIHFGNAMYGASKNQDEANIEYIDKKTRNAIGDLMVEIAGPVSVSFGQRAEYSRKHDAPEAHAKGYVFEPKDAYDVEISTHVRKQAPEKLPTGLRLSTPEIRNLIVQKRPNVGIKKCAMLFH